MIKIQLSSSGSAIIKEEQLDSLREKCQNTEFFLVRIFPHSDWIRRDTYSVQMQKNTDQKNSVFGCFSRRDCNRTIIFNGQLKLKKIFWSNYFLYFFNMLVFTLVSVLLFCVVAKAVVLLFFKAIQEAGGFA